MRSATAKITMAIASGKRMFMVGAPQAWTNGEIVAVGRRMCQGGLGPVGLSLWALDSGLWAGHAPKPPRRSVIQPKPKAWSPEPLSGLLFLPHPNVLEHHH